MPKVESRKARKDYPDAGIKRGDQYYYVSMKTGPRSSKVMRSLTPFKRWQLTTSPYYSTLWEIEDRIGRFEGDDGDLEAIVEELRELSEETQSSFDNMPEGLQQGDTGQMLEERVSELEELISALEQIEYPDTDDEDAEEKIADFYEQIQASV